MRWRPEELLLLVEHAGSMAFGHAKTPGHRVPDAVEAVGGRVLGAAIEVHRALGPGLLERAYALALRDVLEEDGARVEAEVPIPVTIRGRSLEAGFRADMIVERCVLVEVKSVEEIHPVHKAQVLTYLRLSGLPLGYLLNFRVARMQAGMKRFINA